MLTSNRLALALLADWVQCENCRWYGKHAAAKTKVKHLKLRCHYLLDTPRYPKPDMYRDCKYFQRA